jgi:glycosyltransferase involved in cell wall biosynthesis
VTSVLTAVIPVFNRGELVRYTLESVRRAAEGLSVEVIVVDDGSEPPAAESIARLGFAPERILRQANQGLLFARLAGLAAATGHYVLFLDSDDLISREKLRLQVAAMESSQADVSYTDTARCTLEGGYDALTAVPEAPYADASDSAELFITIQPAPHAPVFRTEFLRRTLSEAILPPSPLYNSVAEIWFYHNAATRPARVVRVSGPHAISGMHRGERLTNHWERLGVASLAVMEAFARACPDTPATARARQLVAEKAFTSWRRLPQGFSPEFGRRILTVWRRLDRRADCRRLGGPFFRSLAWPFGPVGAARLLGMVRRRSYGHVRTMDDASVRQLLLALPPP